MPEGLDGVAYLPCGANADKLLTMLMPHHGGERVWSAVSNDNPFSEALFRTLKYRPRLPVRPLQSLLQARRWVTQLVHWYNHEHRHSAIGFVTPHERHLQIDRLVLTNRAAVYAAARDRHPRRWSGATRNWTRIETVHLNPEKPTDQTLPFDRKVA